jgi:hypothetical protein
MLQQSSSSSSSAKQRGGCHPCGKSSQMLRAARLLTAVLSVRNCCRTSEAAMLLQSSVTRAANNTHAPNASAWLTSSGARLQ